MGKALRFKNKRAYEKWLAYGHIHEVFERTPGHQNITIRGLPHKVNHKRS